jgi:hypothetical protein
MIPIPTFSPREISEDHEAALQQFREIASGSIESAEPGKTTSLRERIQTRLFRQPARSLRVIR